MRLKRGLKVLNRSVERGGFSCQSKALHLITGSAGGFILDTYVTSHTELCGGLPNTYSMITQDTSSRHQTGLNSLFKKEKSQMKSSALLCSTLYCITAGLRSCSAHVCLCYELYLITADTLKHYSLQSLNIYPGKMDRWT